MKAILQAGREGKQAREGSSLKEAKEEDSGQKHPLYGGEDGGGGVHSVVLQCMCM